MILPELDKYLKTSFTILTVETVNDHMNHAFMYIHTHNLQLLNTIINKIQNKQQVNSKFVDDLNVLGTEPKA